MQLVARHAYRITDEQVEQLLASGYTQDQVFEITCVAAFGASLSSLESLHRALFADRTEAP